MKLDELRDKATLTKQQIQVALKTEPRGEGDTSFRRTADTAIAVMMEEFKAVVEALWKAREALRYTQEYIEDGLLPALPGWSWYEGIKDADEALAAHAALQEEIDHV